MAKRTKKATGTKTKLPVKKLPAQKKKPTAQKAPLKKAPSKKQLPYSPEAKSHLETLHNLEKKLQEAFEELRRHLTKKDVAAIRKSQSKLLLLLGECDYMAKEYMRCGENTWV